MKFLNNLFRTGIALFLSALFFIACSEDDEPLIPDAPILTVLTTPSEINDTIRIFNGQSVEFDIVVSAETGFNRLIVEAVNESGTTIFSEDTARVAGNVTNEFSTEFLLNFDDPNLANTSIDVIITAVTDDDQSISDEFVVFVEEGIDQFSAVLIGGFNNNDLGSSYDSQQDSVFSAGDLRDNAVNQERIDFVYYFANTPQRTIAAPDNAEAEITWNAQNTLSWPFGSIENSTRFKRPTGTVNFENLASPNDLESLFGEVGEGDSRITNLSQGDVISFQLDFDRGSRFGAFEGAAVEGNSSGTITLNVKIEREDN